MSVEMTRERTISLGMQANWERFALLVVVNVFVGGMVGLERTILPLIALEDFGIASKAAAISFIVTFGVTKAAVNFFAGSLSDHWGRKQVLLLGWLIGLPIPLLIMFAQSWFWILFANILLGVNQALTWSMTVVMKVDIAQPRQRGLAIGLNEFAGYGGVAAIAYVTSVIATQYGLRPEPFYVGLGLALAGLILSTLTTDTRKYALKTKVEGEARLPLRQVFRRTTWTDATLSASSLSGLVTNLKDGMLWGLLPIYLSTKGLNIAQIGAVVALYPITWSVTQLACGPLSDWLGRKSLLTPGMALQGVGIMGFVLFNSHGGYFIAAALTGLGTAMVYPTLLALVSDVAEPTWRASALGIYRFWRDLGYAVGALGAGLLADALNIPSAMVIVAGLAFLSAATVAIRVKETKIL
jgi:MFS family permease